MQKRVPNTATVVSFILTESLKNTATQKGIGLTAKTLPNTTWYNCTLICADECKRHTKRNKNNPSELLIKGEWENEQVAMKNRTLIGGKWLKLRLHHFLRLREEGLHFISLWCWSQLFTVISLK